MWAAAHTAVPEAAYSVLHSRRTGTAQRGHTTPAEPYRYDDADPHRRSTGRSPAGSTGRSPAPASPQPPAPARPARPAARHRRAVPVGAGRLRLGQRLLRGGRAGRLGELEGVVLRL